MKSAIAVLFLYAVTGCSTTTNRPKNVVKTPVVPVVKSQAVLTSELDAPYLPLNTETAPAVSGD